MAATAGSRVRRPVLQWFGGKWVLRNWILDHLPPHAVYVEPFGGAASVLLAKSPAPVEVYNDLDGDLVNFFRVLQNAKQAAQLCQRLRLTLYSRAELATACAVLRDAGTSPDDRAWAFFVASWQGFGGGHPMRQSAGRWGRTRTSTAGQAQTVSKWLGAVDQIPIVIARFRCVQIECRDALAVLRDWDGPDTCFYCDPPYPLGTRKGEKNYAVEPDHDFHRVLVERLMELRGAALVSTYRSPLYDPLLEAGWRMYLREADCSASRAGRTRQVYDHARVSNRRTEALYVKPTGQGQLELTATPIREAGWQD